MQMVLILTSKTSGRSTHHDLALKEPVILGRHLESPILLQGEGLSRRHLALSLKEGVMSIQDLSSNGTWLNGIQLRSQTLVRLRLSDVLEIPGYEIRISNPPAQPTANFPNRGAEVGKGTPLPRWASMFEAATEVVDRREMLLVGCVMAAVLLLITALAV